MSSLWTPHSAQARATRAQQDAERQAFVEYMRGLLPETRRINRELHDIDPYLELVFVGERAPDDDPAIVPGRWHVVRHNPDAPDTWLPVVGENDSYAEPTSRIFERLAEGNMWNSSHLERKRKREARRAAERERDKERNRVAMAEELNEHLAAASRTQVSLNTDTPWAQNHQGTRRRGPKSGRPDSTPE